MQASPGVPCLTSLAPCTPECGPMGHIQLNIIYYVYRLILPMIELNGTSIAFGAVYFHTSQI